MDGNCPAHSGIEKEIETLKESDKKQWEAIDHLRNRLPVWATLLISVLTFALGATLTYAGMK
ncbi:MAG: hypothetical protein JW947_09055 [Sedimentisphaerales bacterium]|nr:hypothetical protein [Sedimentisphaerales bacterium]